MSVEDLELLSEKELKELIDKEKLPRHIAIIMDGNGRWAKARHLPRIEGHRNAVKTVREVVEACGELEIEVLTLYAFSTENWRRPGLEVRALMRLLREQLRRQTEELNENNVQLRAIGQTDKLPKNIRQELENSIELTKYNTGLILNLAINYGSRQEIVQAVHKIAQAVKNGLLDVDEINEEQFANYLYTSNLLDPDLLIRTSGEMRISNFLLWQLAYSELYITPVLWPDFTLRDLFIAIIDYQRRNRRFGGLDATNS